MLRNKTYVCRQAALRLWRAALLAAVCLLAVPQVCRAQAAEMPLPIDGRTLDDVRKAYRSGDKATVSRVRSVMEYAGKYLSAKPRCVTEKRKTAPSNDRRDYVTLSPYWWRDTTKADGLPYVRRDGQRNPEVDEYTDRDAAGEMGNCVDYMSVLYYVTGDEKYAEACARQLRTWFTDPRTGMNPNMTYAQIIPGRTTLRGTGIIDSRRFVRSLLMSGLLSESPSWTSDDRRRLAAWAEAFLYWMENSTQGRKEATAENNHGLWYDTIHIMLLAFLDRTADVERAVSTGLMVKMEAQIAPDGSLPKELQRTLSLHYSTFVMDALVCAAHVVRPQNIDLWTMTTAKGTGMSSIVNFLQPYYLNPEAWPHTQIKPFDRSRGAVMLYEAAVATGDKGLMRAARKIGYEERKGRLETLLYHNINE